MKLDRKIKTTQTNSKDKVVELGLFTQNLFPIFHENNNNKHKISSKQNKVTHSCHNKTEANRNEKWKILRINTGLTKLLSPMN